MWFKREYSGYGCPMCGRLPVLAEGQTEKYCETLKAVKTQPCTGSNVPESTSLQTGTATLWVQASTGNTSLTNTRGRTRNEQSIRGLLAVLGA